ncbi:MAG: hypothetical protein KGZ68_05060 [Dechloromonas sp.]|jgi:hypothetical protein|nr:hypothetical protein [Dechloromonas sp.]
MVWTRTWAHLIAASILSPKSLETASTAVGQTRHQIADGSGRQAVHVAVLLAQALDG